MQVERNQFGAYVMVVTESQLATFKQHNERSKPENQRAFGGNCDAVEIVSDDDPRADMITSTWYGLTIGILPDGSSHS